MRERMFHIVNLIVEHLLKENSLSFYEAEMADLLRSHGFEADEISEAFHWLHHFAPGGDGGVGEREGSGKAFRALSEEERLAFSSEAWGYLLQLQQTGMMDDSMREEVIQRSLSLVEGEITRDDLRAIALLVAFHRSQTQWQTDFIRLLRSENTSFLN